MVAFCVYRILKHLTVFGLFRIAEQLFQSVAGKKGGKMFISFAMQGSFVLQEPVRRLEIFLRSLFFLFIPSISKMNLNKLD